MATEIIPEKICPHCGGNEWYVSIRNGNKKYQCKIRNKELAKANPKKNIEKYILSGKAWRERNKDKIKIKNAERNYKFSSVRLIIPDKVCPHCNDNYWEAITNLHTGTISYRCVNKVKTNSKSTYQKYREKIIGFSLQWQRNNKDKRLVYQKDWRILHIEQLIVSQRKYRNENKEKFAEYSKRYSLTHKEVLAERLRKYRKRKQSETKKINRQARYYIKSNLCEYGITDINITRNDIKLYREGLIAKRMFRKFKTQQLETQES